MKKGEKPAAGKVEAAAAGTAVKLYRFQLYLTALVENQETQIPIADVTGITSREVNLLNTLVTQLTDSGILAGVKTWYGLLVAPDKGA